MMNKDFISLYLGSLLLLFVTTTQAIPAPPFVPEYDVAVQQTDAGLRISWQTLDDEWTTGFNLNRSENGGDFTRITPSFLPAPLNAPVGADFSWTDSLVETNKTYQYQLEAFSPQGPYPPQNTPATTVTASPAPQRFPTYSVTPHPLPRRRTATMAPLPSSRSIQAGTPEDLLKITVRERGIYRITASDIAASLNIPTNEVTTLIANRLFRLTSQGRQTAWVPDTENSAILFYNEPLKSMFSLDNVFWLDKGRGLVILQSPTTPLTLPLSKPTAKPCMWNKITAPSPI